MAKSEKLSASLEDYLEIIFKVTEENGVARHKDIKKHIAVSSPSITEACQQLRERGLIHYAPYAPIRLTEEGRKVAEGIVHRHESLKTFFIEVLGVDPETADDGACKMEHVVSEAIIERMIQYTQYVKIKQESHTEEIELFLDQFNVSMPPSGTNKKR